MLKIVCTYTQFFLYALVFSNSLFSTPCPNPCKLEPRKNTLTKKISVPEIELKYLEHHVDFFQSYLNKNEITYPFSKQDSVLQKFPSKSFIKKSLYDFEENASIQTFLKKANKPTFSSIQEESTNTLFHKSFLYDLVENVKKYNDLEMVREFFHPEKSNLNVNSLSAVLFIESENNSYSHMPKEAVNLLFYEKEVNKKIAKSKDAVPLKFCKRDDNIYSDMDFYNEMTAILLSKQSPKMIDPIAAKSLQYIIKGAENEKKIAYKGTKSYGFAPNLSELAAASTKTPLNNPKHKNHGLKNCKSLSFFDNYSVASNLKVSSPKRFVPISSKFTHYYSFSIENPSIKTDYESAFILDPNTKKNLLESKCITNKIALARGPLIKEITIKHALQKKSYIKKDLHYKKKPGSESIINHDLEETPMISLDSTSKTKAFHAKSMKKTKTKKTMASRTFSSIKSALLATESSLNEIDLFIEASSKQQPFTKSSNASQLNARKELITLERSFYGDLHSTKSDAACSESYINCEHSSNITFSQIEIGYLGKIKANHCEDLKISQSDLGDLAKSPLENISYSKKSKMPLQKDPYFEPTTLVDNSLYEDNVSCDKEVSYVKIQYELNPEVEEKQNKERLQSQEQAIVLNVPYKEITSFKVSDNYEYNPAASYLKLRGPKEHNIRVKQGALFKEKSLITKSIYQKVSLPYVNTIKSQSAFFLNPMLSLINSNQTDISQESIKFAHHINRSTRMTHDDLGNWPSLDDLNTQTYYNIFKIDTVILDSKDSDYNFSCTLKTSPEFLLKPLAVHVLYILDASSSIEPHRFALFKESILYSLEMLDDNSLFNIAVIGNKGVNFIHDKSIKPTLGGKSYVKRALNKIKQSGQTSKKTLINLLKKEKLLAKDCKYHRASVILSDGNLIQNIRVDRSLFKEINEINSSNYAFYTASVSDKNNRSMLSLLSKLNHGFSLYCTTHSGFPRRFCKMIGQLKQPILQDLRIFFPKDNKTKPLFAEARGNILLGSKNFTFYGKTAKKEDSRVFIQGRLGNQWVNIIQDIALSSARKARSSQKKALLMQKTLHCYAKFIQTKDEQYLTNAKNSIEEFKLNTARNL